MLLLLVFWYFNWLSRKKLFSVLLCILCFFSGGKVVWWLVLVGIGIGVWFWLGVVCVGGCCVVWFIFGIWLWFIFWCFMGCVGVGDVVLWFIFGIWLCFIFWWFMGFVGVEVFWLWFMLGIVLWFMVEWFMLLFCVVLMGFGRFSSRFRVRVLLVRWVGFGWWFMCCFFCLFVFCGICLFLCGIVGGSDRFSVLGCWW